MKRELKQRVIDIIYWAEWDGQMRENGYEERWLKDEDIIVEAIIEEVRGSLSTASK